MKYTRADKADLFIGVYPGGIVYADPNRERHGDYVRLAFLPYDTLVLQIERDCPAFFQSAIEAAAALIIAKRGQQFSIDHSGHTVRLGRVS